MAEAKPEPGWKKAVAGGKEEIQPCTKRFLRVDNSLIEVIMTLTVPGWKQRTSSLARSFLRIAYDPTLGASHGVSPI
jgi:hypothetical protein